MKRTILYLLGAIAIGCVGESRVLDEGEPTPETGCRGTIAFRNTAGSCEVEVPDVIYLQGSLDSNSTGRIVLEEPEIDRTFIAKGESFIVNSEFDEVDTQRGYEGRGLSSLMQYKGIETGTEGRQYARFQDFCGEETVERRVQVFFEERRWRGTLATADLRQRWEFSIDPEDHELAIDLDNDGTVADGYNDYIYDNGELLDISSRFDCNF